MAIWRKNPTKIVQIDGYCGRGLRRYIKRMRSRAIRRDGRRLSGIKKYRYRGWVT